MLRVCPVFQDPVMAGSTLLVIVNDVTSSVGSEEATTLYVTALTVFVSITPARRKKPASASEIVYEELVALGIESHVILSADFCH
jgi:hypothetical protein